MCLIIHRSQSSATSLFVKPLSQEIISHNKRVNPDGFGIAWRVDGELRYDKYAPNQFDQFAEALALVDGTDYEYTAHFRKATHGAPSQELSHPFEYVDPEAGLVLVFHNGVLDIKTGKDESDTKVFVDLVLKRLGSRWWDNPALVWLVEEAISPSRMLIMTPEETIILNENSWRDIDGFDFSTQPLPAPKKVVTTPATGYEWKKPEQTASCDVPAVPSKSAEESAAILLPETTGTTPKAGEGELVIPPPTGIVHLQGRTYRHRKHEVSIVSVDDVDDDGDEWGAAFCQTCYALGSYYRIDGKLQFDVPHGVFEESAMNDAQVKEAVEVALAATAESATKTVIGASGSRPRLPSTIGFVPQRVESQPVPTPTLTKVG